MLSIAYYAWLTCILCIGTPHSHDDNNDECDDDDISVDDGDVDDF
jgi:hypothetical protein